MAKAIHMMVRVLDEQRSLRFYKEVFGLDIADRFDFDGFSLIYLRNAENDFELELTVNRGTTEPYDLGNGYGHLAFAVDDLAGSAQCVDDPGVAVGIESDRLAGDDQKARGRRPVARRRAISVSCGAIGTRIPAPWRSWLRRSPERRAGCCLP